MKFIESPLPNYEGNSISIELPSGKWICVDIDLFETLKSSISKFRVLQQDLEKINWCENFDIECAHQVFYNIDNKMMQKSAILLRRKR
ncbi:MAG: hypothetical protein NZM44_05985 [Candidatus Calescibacterium sp.]|nr:hypothetical protein [Candidatus Calescibacterium sp.]